MPTQPSQITEHEKPISDSFNKQGSSNIPNEEKDDLKMVTDLYGQGKKLKDELIKNWDKRWKYYNDQQWDTKRPKYRAAPVFNIIKTTIQSILPILTDLKPGFNIVPEEPDDFQFAEILSQVTESWWSKYGLDHTLIEVLMDSMIYDAGIIKIVWNQDLLEGIGDIDIKVVDPRNIYLPYAARDFDKDCPWVIEIMEKTVGELKRKFPKKAHIIKPDKGQKSQDSDKGDSDFTGVTDDVTLVSPTDKRDYQMDGSTATAQSASDDRKTAKIAQCWMDDDSLEEYWQEQEKDDGSKEKVKKYKKKYPRGKLVTILLEQKVVLFSGENPYKHASKPYVRFIDTILPRRFWGEGEAQNLMEMQKIINKVLANIIDYMNLTGNPIWKVEKGSGVDPDSITNQTGLILEPNAGKSGAVTREIPPSLPQYIINLYQMLIRASEQISGSTEISQGRKPSGGVPSGVALETLQEASQTRIRLKERNMQVSLGQMGSFLVQLVMQFYTAPRITRITGKEGWPEFFEFYVEDVGDGKVVAHKKGYKFDEKERKYHKEEEFTTGLPSKGIFDVKVLAGTSVPHAKAQRSNVAFRLFDSQVIDRENLLDTLEWPDKEDVLRRIQKKEEEIMAQQALAAQTEEQ